MNITNDCRTCNVNFRNLGGGHYTILKENENVEKNPCNLNLIDLKYLGDKLITNGTFYSIRSDANTKFYVMSLSVIGIYIFSCILIKSKYF
jgi:hypothetical protein